MGRHRPFIILVLSLLSEIAVPACRRRGTNQYPAAQEAGTAASGGGARGPGGSGIGGRGGTAGIATGTGAVGGASEAPDIWRNAPDAWTLVPGPENCRLYSADVTKVQIPPRIWTSCGLGCQVASANALATDAGTGRASATGTFRNGEIYLRLVSESPVYSLGYTWRLSDSHTVAAVLQRPLGPCGPLGWSRASPQIIPFFFFNGGGDLVATSRLDDSPVVWSPVVLGLPVHTNVFSNDLGWGATFSDGSVRYQTPLDAPQMTIVERSSINERAAARRDLVVWTSAVPNMQDVLKGYRPPGQVKVLVAGSRKIISVALSDTSMIWIAASGPHVNDGTNEYAEFSWSGWPDNLDAIQAQGTVPIPGTDNTDLRSLQVGGDFAATIGCLGVQCRALILGLSTGKVWIIPSRPTFSFVDVLAVSDREVVLAENENSANPQTIQRLIRLDTAHLDELQTAW